MSCLGTVTAYRCDACGRVLVAAAAGHEPRGADEAKLIGWAFQLQPIGVVDVVSLAGHDLSVRLSEPALLPRGAPERWRAAYDSLRHLCPRHPDEPGLGLPLPEAKP